jgi:multidrug resistance efflux pump
MRWKAVAAVALVLAAVAAGLGFFWPWGTRADVLRLPGVVEIQEVRLGPRVSGRVREVLVQEGDTVEAEKVVVRLEAPELKAQHEQAVARLHDAEALLDKAHRGPRQREKDAAEALVRAAEARLERLEKGNREEDKRAAEADFKAAEVDLQLAREQMDRARRLLDSGAGGQEEYDNAKRAHERAQRRVQAARARHELMQKGARPEDIREARADLEQARANWRLLLEGTRSEDIASAEARVAEAQGRVRELETLLGELEVRAPEPAVVEVVAVRRGDLVTANQSIVRVLRTSDLWVKVFVPETEMGRVRLHEKVELTVDGYPGRRFAGEVFHIAAESEFTPRNVQSVDERRHQVFGVRVRVADPKGVFKSGMAAEVLLPVPD